MNMGRGKGDDKGFRSRMRGSLFLKGTRRPAALPSIREAVTLISRHFPGQPPGQGIVFPRRLSFPSFRKGDSTWRSRGEGNPVQDSPGQVKRKHVPVGAIAALGSVHPLEYAVSALMVERRRKVEFYNSDQRFSFHRLADTRHSSNPKARTKFNNRNVFLHQLFCRSYGFFIIL